MVGDRGCLSNVEAVKSRLARGYSRTAREYDALAGPLYLTGIQRLLPRLRVPPMAAILDVGTGTGVNLLEAARWFAPARLLCGIDLSPGMVEIATAKAIRLGVPAQFTTGDAEKLPYPDQLFDLVICNSVLHWFHDRAAALREMHRVLRPGGQVALVCAAAPGFREWFAIMDEVSRLINGGTTPSLAPNLPTSAEVAAGLRQAGFVIEHLAHPVRRQWITHAESFVRLMSTVAPAWIADLPASLQPAFEQAVAQYLRTRWPAGFPLTWSAVEAVATRVR
jgi:ubiquinone/menaquinone biosynthesis C-methylase UbiE